LKKKIFISVGDPSGDIHAARLMKKINDSIDAEFLGIGGKLMEEQGLNSITSLKDISVVGFWEVAKKYRFFKRLLEQSKDILHKENIDLFLPVDYPGFNLRLSAFSKKNNIPVVYYIAPQLWAWGNNRAKKLNGKIDKLCVVFPFEEEYFKNQGIDAEYIGHPLLEDPNFNIPYQIKENLSKTKLDKSKSDFLQKDNNLIAFMPGSRQQEIKRHNSLYIQCIEKLSAYNSSLKFGIARNSNISIADFDVYSKFKNVEIYNDSRELMKKAYCGIVKTGTSTLEAALLGMPFTMIYKTSALTYNIGKHLVNLPYISLVNILREKEVIKELIQKDANAELITKSIIELIENKIKYNSIIDEFDKIREYLGNKKASENALKIIINFLENMDRK